MRRSIRHLRALSSHRAAEITAARAAPRLPRLTAASDRGLRDTDAAYAKSAPPRRYDHDSVADQPRPAARASACPRVEAAAPAGASLVRARVAEQHGHRRREIGKAERVGSVAPPSRSPSPRTRRPRCRRRDRPYGCGRRPGWYAWYTGSPTVPHVLKDRRPLVSGGRSPILIASAQGTERSGMN